VVFPEQRGAFCYGQLFSFSPGGFQAGPVLIINGIVGIPLPSYTKSSSPSLRVIEESSSPPSHTPEGTPFFFPSTPSPDSKPPFPAPAAPGLPPSNDRLPPSLFFVRAAHASTPELRLVSLSVSFPLPFSLELNHGRTVFCWPRKQGRRCGSFFRYKS